MVRRLLSVAAVASFMFATGCATTTPEGAGEMGAEGDDNRTMETRGTVTTVTETVPREFRTIYFDFDSAGLMSGAKSDLKYNAGVLRAHPDARVVVEGNCDERGSAEYNLALGNRRAEAAKRYLLDMGIAGSRVSTVSYGEERPAVKGSSERAWSKNRRDDFVAR